MANSAIDTQKKNRETKKIIYGMSYLEWQERNTKYFDKLTKVQKKEARTQGYYNIGWHKVISSWNIITNFNNNIIMLFEYKLGKGDVIGAIDQSIAESNRASILAKQAIDSLDKTHNFLHKLAETTLIKYPFL
jgi:hypothetical protein